MRKGVPLLDQLGLMNPLSSLDSVSPNVNGEVGLG